VGAACAAALARAGHRVRVLHRPTRSTTAVSGGHLLLQSKRPGASLEMARRSLELLAEFAAGQEADLQYRRQGSLILAATEAEEAALRAHFTTLAGDGLPLEWLDGDAARRLEPALAPEVRAASFCPLDAQIHPAALAGAWLQEAIAHGASLTSGVSVESFVTEHGAVCGVVAGGAEYPAAAVVIAAGPWSAEVAAMAGVALNLQPRRGVLLRAQSERPLAARPLLGAAYLEAKFGATERAVAFSFQQHPDGSCLLGGSREFAGFSDADVGPIPEQIRECSAGYLPALRELAWEEPLVGFRPWSPDGQPRIGAASVPGVYLACGHEGDGITLAAATAELIAAAVTRDLGPPATRRS